MTRIIGRGWVAAFAVCLCATSAGAAGPAFDYSIEPIRDGETTGTTGIEVVDPERCGSDLGWIERLESEFKAEASDEPLHVSRSVRVRKGGRMEYPHRHFGEQPDRLNSTVMAQYTGCVTPTARVLLSFEAQVAVEAHDAPLRFLVTYEGPPLVVEHGFGLWGAKLKNFNVETDLGDAVLYGLSLWWPPLSAEPIKDFSISLRMRSRGGTE